ncbi:MAG: glycosyltransferase, partial [Myxococcota bacterium]|nr:glycosyltransferase [Myxococcota bacterium]
PCAPRGSPACSRAAGAVGPPAPPSPALGRLVPIKGIDDLIRAVARVDLPDVSLHIAGDGPERERLEALSLEFGVRATFHGVVRGAQKRRLLEQSALSIFASRAEEGRHEGLPVSFLECASACAYPLVAELPGALPLLHDPDRQRLDPGRDLDHWAARIKEELASSGRARHEFMARSLAQRELVIPLSWERLGIKWAEALSQPSTFSRR